MIPTEDYYQQLKRYTFNGSGMWKVLGYCPEPSLIMVNLETDERMNFGVSGAAASMFDIIEEELNET